MAIQSKFNPTPSVRSSRSSNRESDERVVRRYVEYVQKKNSEWSIVDAVFGFVKTLVLGILGMLLRIRTECAIFSAHNLENEVLRNRFLKIV
jgi:hypothetical protein